MENKQATITYLFHSGFTVETANHFLIFDYYQPTGHTGKTVHDGFITAEYLQNKKNVYVFSSHAHGDHFDPVILTWASLNPEITYILSDDIKVSAQGRLCRFVGKDQDIAVEGLTVRTLGSTDEGVAFLVQADGLSLFHAGDLNWWHWKGESSLYLSQMESDFKAEIGKLAGTHIDIAFFPVDRRLEEFFSVGAEYIVATLHPSLLIPMHFGKDYGATSAFAEKTVNQPVKTVEITHRGQTISF